jgi:hypothetical protein
MSHSLLQYKDDDFYLQLGQLNQNHTQYLCRSFDNLTTNSYKDGEFRLRRFSHFNFKNNQINQLPHKGFLQSAEFNDYQGGVERHFDEIEADVVKSYAFLELFKQFKSMTNFSDDTNIDVHQMRISTLSGEQRPLTPEGVHQDGYQHIAICILQRKHIKEGGDLCIHTSKESDAFMQYTFDAGEFIVLNDQRFWHSGTDIIASEKHDAIMDAFILLV